jgi:hypothetical protein
LRPYHETCDTTGDLLTLAVRGGHDAADLGRLTDLYDALPDDAVFEAARKNKVTHGVADALERALGERLPVSWSESLAENESRVEALLDMTEQLTGGLTALGIPSAAVESAGVLLGSDLPTRALGSGDLDLLVPSGAWERSLDLASELGFVRGDRQGQVSTRRAKLSGAGPQGQPLWIEACAHPFERTWVPLRVQDRSDVWLERAVESRKRPKISVLDPHDALAFVALHTSLHSFVRSPGLRLHMDVDRLARDNALDWSRVVEEIHGLGARTRSFVSLMMARGVLDTPIPDAALEALAPTSARWRKLCDLLEAEGVLHRGAPKLGRVQTLRLDLLLEEGSVGSWLANVALPDRVWLARHFAPDEPNLGWARLHGRRLVRLATRWRPQ